MNYLIVKLDDAFHEDFVETFKEHFDIDPCISHKAEWAKNVIEAASNADVLIGERPTDIDGRCIAYKCGRDLIYYNAQLVTGTANLDFSAKMKLCFLDPTTIYLERFNHG